ncbi:hypothetical protein ES703_110668 [subsurface metagenome]
MLSIEARLIDLQKAEGVANKSYTLEEIRKLLAQEEEEWRRKNVGLHTAEQT